MMWSRMVMPKEEEGLGFEDPRILEKVVIVRCVHKIWLVENSCWVLWMRQHYIRGQALATSIS